MSSTGVPETEGPLFHPPALRRDVGIVRVQEHVYLQAYWKELSHGRGPALILYLFGIETLKFDLFGKGRGHFHVNPNNPEYGDANVLWFPEASASAQVERAAFELRRNLPYYLERNVDERIRALCIDELSLSRAVDEARAILLGFLETVPALQEI
ncbi:MAG: hypothetical protein WB783_03825 [Arenicellales bacterium]|jgi:hypothetical protein